MQRNIENQSFKAGISVADRAKAEAFFKAFSAQVDAAYKYVVSVPSLGALAGLNGHTKLWATKWNEYLNMIARS